MTRPHRGEGGVGLRSAAFGLVWSVVLTSNSAMFALILVGGAYAYRLSGGSELWSSSVFSAVLIPTVLVGPLSGPLVDRYPRASVLRAGSIVGFCACAGLTVMAWAGAGGMAALVAGCLVAGAGRGLISPSWQALLPGMLGSRALLRGGALMRIAQQGGEFVGPAVAAALMTVSTGAAFAVCAVLYAMAAVLTVGLPGLRATGHGHEPVLTAIRMGAAYIARTRPIAITLVLLALHCSLTMAFLGLLPGLASDHLHQPALYGTLVAALGLGAIGGAATVAVAADRLDTTRTLVVTAVASGVTLAWLGLSSEPWLAVVAAVFSGAAQAAFMADAYVVTQRLADDRFRGRVASLSGMLTAGSMSLLAPLWGALAHHTSTPAVLVATGGGFAVLVLLGLLVWPETRRRSGLAVVSEKSAAVATGYSDTTGAAP